MKKANVGDILILDSGAKYQVIESANNSSEPEYLLVNLPSYFVEMWEDALDFKIGDDPFDANMKIVQIIPKENIHLVTNLMQ